MKRIVSILLVFVVFISIQFPYYSHNKKEHDDYLKQVLFGEVDYKKYDKNKGTKDKIDDICYASQLAIDSYGKNGDNYYDELKDSIKNLPELETIQLVGKGVGDHRECTHHGWEHDYGNNNDIWENRKDVIRKTVEQKIEFTFFDNFSKEKKNDIENFCKLIYYVHILGDYCKFYDDAHGSDKMEAKDIFGAYVNSSYEKIMPLGSSNGDSICSELQSIVEEMFADESGTKEYKALVKKIESVNKDYRVKDDESNTNLRRFENQNKKAHELMELLIKYIPKLLQSKKWFTKSFSI